ncbi:MAG: hypothetical protein K2H66_06075 [Oscillospiraceae bacterium]|nr:hypothetical protein [Oscillospiraceae bacterium]
MSKLKRTLALLATFAVASTAFVACGKKEENNNSSADNNSVNNSVADDNNAGDDANSDADSDADSDVDSDVDSDAEDGGNDTPSTGGDISLPDTDDVLTIVCWTDSDLSNMFDIYTTVQASEVKYQNCGGNGTEASTQYANYLNSGDDVDLFVAEAGWILNYINDDTMSAPLSDLGISTADYADAYQYTVEIGTDNNGVLKGASWQAAAGGWVYNADLAKEYLGVESEDDMQAKVSSWDNFKATAEELKTATDGAVTMTCTLPGLWQAYSTALNASWVDGTTINTSIAKDFTEMAKEYADNGYVDPSIEQWKTEWENWGKDGKTLGYFFSTWCLGEGAQLDTCCGTEGNWRIIQGPQEYFWGGSWLCVSPNCNTATEAANFIRTFTCNAGTMEEYALYSGDFANNKVAMNKIIADGSNSNSSLGGQDQFAILADVAAGIKMSDSISKYDQNLKDTFLTILKDNINEDTDTIVEKFKAQALADNTDLS